MTAVAEPLRVVTAPDGREVAFAVWGDPEGFPVMRLHGTPGCRLMRWADEAVYASLGACYVTHDRAGYGRSSRLRGRRVVDDVDDVHLIADELGFEQFGVSGGSGGGPARARLRRPPPGAGGQSDLCGRKPPYGPPGLDHDAWFAGMNPRTSGSSGLRLKGRRC